MTASAIDQATFTALQETAGADFVKELVATFQDEAPKMLSDLRKALAAQDAERFRRTAHSLKSNSNTFGALELGNLARTLELGGLPKADAAATQSLDALDSEYARASTSLEKLCNV